MSDRKKDKIVLCPACGRRVKLETSVEGLKYTFHITHHETGTPCVTSEEKR